MPAWNKCAESSYAAELRRLLRVLARHAESCKGGRDCPLRLLECVAARHVGLQMRDGVEIVPWPRAKR